MRSAWPAQRTVSRSAARSSSPESVLRKVNFAPPWPGLHHRHGVMPHVRRMSLIALGRVRGLERSPVHQEGRREPHQSSVSRPLVPSQRPRRPPLFRSALWLPRVCPPLCSPQAAGVSRRLWSAPCGSRNRSFEPPMNHVLAAVRSNSATLPWASPLAINGVPELHARVVNRRLRRLDAKASRESPPRRQSRARSCVDATSTRRRFSPWPESPEARLPSATLKL